MVNATIASNLNYRFDLYPNFWVEPTVGAQYTNSRYGSNAFHSGGFIPVGSFEGNNLLVQSDQGFVRGRGNLAFNFDFGDGITSFVQGDVYGGAHLFGAGGKAGVRVQW